MKGDKYVLYVPNKGHAAIDMPRLIANFSGLIMRVAGKVTFPKMTWDLQASERALTLTIEADREIEHAWAYLATSATRDFRKSKWEHKDMTRSDKGGSYELPMPEEGYAAMYGEVLFKLEAGQPLYLCTNVKIIGPGPKTPRAPAKTSDQGASK
jgi:PhoPQ-activated pathogenicity-related protein